MFCGECGTANPETAKFCEECGAPLIAGKVSPKRRAFSTKRWTLVIILACALLGAAAYFYPHRPKEDESKQLYWPAFVTVADKCRLLGRDGRLLPSEFDGGIAFNKSGLAPVMVRNRWGYADKTGALKIKPVFEAAWVFDKNGLAPVKFDNRWGWIDISGRTVIPPKYDSVGLDLASRDVIAFSLGLNLDSPELVAFSDSSGLAKVELNGRWGFIDRAGKVQIEPQFDDAHQFDEEGMAAVRIGGRWGFIDRSGKFVIDPQFDDVGTTDLGTGTEYHWSWGAFTSSDLAPVRIGDKWGYIDRSGRQVLPPQFESAGKFNKRGLAPVKKEGHWGLIDTTGTMVIPAQYGTITNFDKAGRAWVSLDGNSEGSNQKKYQLMSEQGEILTKTSFEGGTQFGSSGIALVGLGNKVGAIDAIGKIIINPVYDVAILMSETNEIVGLIDDQITIMEMSGEARSRHKIAGINRISCRYYFE